MRNVVRSIMKSYKDKQLLFGLLFLGIAAGITGHGIEAARTAVFSSSDNTNLNSATALLATNENLATKSPPPPNITLGFAGDIMTDRGVRKQVLKNLGGDYTKLFTNAEFLKEPDIMFANLEGPVSDKGADKHNLYSFHMAPATIPALKNAGIDIVSVANNHAGDWGRAAFEDTLTRLSAAGILACGGGMNKREASTPAVISHEGFTVGYLCFSDVGPDDLAATETKSGIILANDPEFDTIIREAATHVNALIVSFHFGVEYQTHHSPRQEHLATRAIDAGAVMVVGGHPHVREDIAEHYNSAPIIYSLGNFIFDQGFSEATLRGVYLTATLSGKTISDVTPHTTVLDSNFAVSLEK